MRKIIFIFLMSLFFISCSNDGDTPTEANIIGIWERYSDTDKDGNVTYHTLNCPDIATFTKTKMTLEDFYEIKEPCEESDIISYTYILKDNTLMITDINGVSDSAEVLTLSLSTLELKNSSKELLVFKRIK